MHACRVLAHVDRQNYIYIYIYIYNITQFIYVSLLQAPAIVRSAGSGGTTASEVVAFRAGVGSTSVEIPAAQKITRGTRAFRPAKVSSCFC